MCCGGFDPSPWLKPGQVVLIKKGHGNPAVTEDTRETIWQVSGGSAMTCRGRQIACFDRTGVEDTGETAPVKPTVRARILYAWVMLHVGLRNLGEWFSGMNDSLQWRLYLLRRRLKKLR